MNSFYESYIGTSKMEREEMLQDIGKEDILDLFSEIPSELLLKDTIEMPGPYSEAELTRFFIKMAAKNANPDTTLSFLGGGTRQQYVPAAIEELMMRGELYTAYTPYQPEISQGMLQLLYEYQSLVAELLDVEVVNASMYDWASAMGEVLRTMNRINKRRKMIVALPISPNRLEVAEAYTYHADIELVVIDSKNGNVDSEKILEMLNEEKEKDKKDRLISGVYFEVPNYFGTLANKAEEITKTAHESGSLVAVGVDPISLGIVRPPGEYDVDFVVGEGQLLGNAPSNGGPLLGILASKYNKKWVRQLPGRLIGETNELISDAKGYCITLSTREQHIRREKATSNICSNQALTAVNAAIYLSALGKNGIVELAQILMNKAHYLAAKLGELDWIVSPVYDQPFFCEFVVEFKGITHEELEELCVQNDILPGTEIKHPGCYRLIAVSELHTKEDLDKFVKILKEVKP